MGMLLRLIILGLVAWAIFRLVQRLLLAARPDAAPQQPPSQDNQVMRRCAWCQVHVPEGESTQSRGEYFCCESHRDAFFRSSTR